MPVPLISPHLSLALPELGSTLLVVLGIGLVIFVHELGHFLCARFVGVRVEVFSLGFGPRLFGWQRGATDYRVSLVPVGGYVKMYGDQPGEGTGAPDELSSRSPGERFLIYSGGVLMNVVFALVVFPLVFALGVPMVAAEVGAVEPGGPAWKAGLQEGDLIRTVNDRSILDFTDFTLEVALGDPDQTELEVERAGEVHRISVRPRHDPEAGYAQVGVGPPIDPELRVVPGGAAERAGLRDGDRLLAIDGVPLSDRARRGLLDGIPVKIAVERGGARLDFTVDPEWRTRDDLHQVGIVPLENLVVGLRGSWLAPAAPLREGDEIVALDGTLVRGPDDLASAARAALVAGDPAPAVLRVRRAGESSDVPVPHELLPALPEDVALAMRTREHPDSIAVRVTDGSPAQRAGLVDGMRVVAVDGAPTRRWSEVQERVRAAGASEVVLAVVPAVPAGDASGVSRREISVRPEPARQSDFGLILHQHYATRSFPAGEAFAAGMRASWNMARQAYLMLRKMVAREVSADNLGGIVAISAVSYQFAVIGITKLLYFLALLSINLAVVNVLPIPVLDGGHLLFILIEKIKGSPVNERVMGYAQVIGLMIILSLLLFVTYNDIKRLIG